MVFLVFLIAFLMFVLSISWFVTIVCEADDAKLLFLNPFGWLFIILSFWLYIASSSRINPVLSTTEAVIEVINGAQYITINNSNTEGPEYINLTEQFKKIIGAQEKVVIKEFAPTWSYWIHFPGENKITIESIMPKANEGVNQ